MPCERTPNGNVYYIVRVGGIHTMLNESANVHT